MSCGTLVVTSNISSLPAVAGDAAILVDPKSVEEITNAMYKVLVDVNIREEMIQKGQNKLHSFLGEKQPRRPCLCIMRWMKDANRY